MSADSKRPVVLDYYGKPRPRPSEAVKSVRILECGACGGTGYVDRGEHTVRCGQCYGRGRVATNGGEV